MHRGSTPYGYPSPSDNLSFPRTRSHGYRGTICWDLGCLVSTGKLSHRDHSERPLKRCNYRSCSAGKLIGASTNTSSFPLTDDLP